MQDHLKDIPVAWYAAASVPVLGWIRSAFKAGQRTQRVMDKLEEVKVDVDTGITKNGQHFNKIYDKLGELGERVAAMEGQQK